MKESFALARMNPLMRGATALVLVLPPLFLTIGLAVGPPTDRVMLVVSALLAASVLAVWVYSRPRCFLVGEGELEIVWPGRRRRIPASEIRSLRLVDARQFKSEFGFTIRIGVGGLWGVFGWLASSRGGLIGISVSRLDGWVLIERTGGRPLVISPDRPDEFARAISNETARAHRG